MGSEFAVNAIAFDSRTDFFEIRTVMAQAATKMNDADIVQYEPLNLLEEGWIGFVIRIAAVAAEVGAQAYRQFAVPVDGKVALLVLKCPDTGAACAAQHGISAGQDSDSQFGLLGLGILKRFFHALAAVSQINENIFLGFHETCPPPVKVTGSTFMAAGALKPAAMLRWQTLRGICRVRHSGH